MGGDSACNPFQSTRLRRRLTPYSPVAAEELPQGGTGEVIRHVTRESVEAQIKREMHAAAIKGVKKVLIDPSMKAAPQTAARVGQPYVPPPYVGP